MPTFAKAVRRYNKTPSRRRVQGVGAETVRPVRTPIVPTFGATALNHSDVQFGQPVTWNGELPPWPNDGPGVVSACVQLTPSSFRITWDAAGAGDIVTIPFEDPTFRNMAGGYVQPGQYTLT